MSDVDEELGSDDGPGHGLRVDTSTCASAGSRWTTLNTSPAHPFSASTHATRRPPLYAQDSARAQAKRRKNAEAVEAARDVVPALVFKEPQRRFASAYTRDTYRYDPYASTKIDLEAELWSKTIDGAVEHAESKIDMM